MRALNRLAALTGQQFGPFPNLGDADGAWHWYRESNHYATRNLSRRHGWLVRRTP